MFPGFEFLGRYIGMYQVMALIGIFSAGGFAIFRYNKKTGSGYPMLATLLYSALGVLVGASLLYGLTNIHLWHYILEASDLMEFVNTIAAVFGGGVFYGGLIGGALTAALVMKLRHYDAPLISDIMGAGTALFHAFGRIGCFCGGCCYGAESDWGVVFTHSLIESANGVRRLPVQLFEAGFEFLLFFVLWQMYEKEKLKGRLFAIYVALYGIWRFFIEFFRGDMYRGFIFGISVSQFISVILVPCAVIYIIVVTARLQKKKAF